MILKLSLNGNNDIDHDSKINNTDVSVGDVLGHHDKIQVGPYTFGKQCKWTNSKCVISKCAQMKAGEKDCEITIEKMRDEALSKYGKQSLISLVLMFVLF